MKMKNVVYAILAIILSIIAIILVIIVGFFILPIFNTYEEVKAPHPPPSPFENEKLGTGLNYTAYLYETQGMDAAVAFISINPQHIVENGRIKISIPVTEENETYLDTLRSTGIEVIDIINATDIGGEILIRGYLPISRIHDIEKLEFVKAVYIESKPVPD
jgi:hypothetical protein